jgi:replication factor A1
MIKQVIETATEFGANDIDPAYVDEKLAKLRKFRVTDEEAIRSVVSGILRAQGIKRPHGAGAPRKNALMTIDDIKEDGLWLNLKIRAVDLWQNEHESIRQVGLIGDGTGTIKFVSWEKANLPTLEEGKCYSIENVVTKEYESTFSVAFNKTTIITEITDEIEVGFTTSGYSGVLVAVQNGSGLIKRCTVCNKAMQKGTCKEHGNVEGIHDLRIRAVLDNGASTQDILLNRERTEELTGITLKNAVKTAQDALDAEIVVEKMRAMLIGQEFVASGRAMGDTILVEEIAANDQPVTVEMIEELIKEV